MAGSRGALFGDLDGKFSRQRAPDAGLRVLLQTHLPMFDWTPIETGPTLGGVPDTNYCYAGIEGWIEAKQTDHWRVKIRPQQIGWIERRCDHGGNVFVAVRRARKELWLYHGMAISRLATQRLDEVEPIGWWGKGPAHWDWGKVQWLLLGKRVVPVILR